MVKEMEDTEEVEVHANAAQYQELSQEQRAVERAVEVERDVIAMENEALKEELRVAKAIAAKRVRKEALEVHRTGLKERIAWARWRDKEWVLTGPGGSTLTPGGRRTVRLRAGAGAGAGAGRARGVGPGLQAAGGDLQPGGGGGPHRGRGRGAGRL